METSVNTPLSLDKSAQNQASRIRSAIRSSLPKDTKSIRDANGRINKKGKEIGKETYAKISSVIPPTEVKEASTIIRTQIREELKQRRKEIRASLDLNWKENGRVKRGRKIEFQEELKKRLLEDDVMQEGYAARKILTSVVTRSQRELTYEKRKEIIEKITNDEIKNFQNQRQADGKKKISDAFAKNIITAIRLREEKEAQSKKGEEAKEKNEEEVNKTPEASEELTPTQEAPPTSTIERTNEILFTIHQLQEVARKRTLDLLRVAGFEGKRLLEGLHDIQRGVRKNPLLAALALSSTLNISAIDSGSQYSNSQVPSSSHTQVQNQPQGGLQLVTRGPENPVKSPEMAKIAKPGVFGVDGNNNPLEIIGYENMQFKIKTDGKQKLMPIEQVTITEGIPVVARNKNMGIRVNTVEAMDLVAKLGVGSVRIDGGWSTVTPEGKLTDQKVVALLEKAKEYKLDVLYQFNPQKKISSEDMYQRLKGILDAYPDVQIEVLNEPDDLNVPFFENRDLKQAAETIKIAQDALSRLRPDKKVVVGALVDPANIPIFAKRIKETNANLDKLEFAIHTYNDKEQVKLMVETMRKNFGKNVSLVITELGADSKENASFIQMLETAREYGIKVYVHQAEDIPDPITQQSFGGVRFDEKTQKFIVPNSRFFTMQALNAAAS